MTKPTDPPNKPAAAPSGPTPDDPLALTELFAGGGEPWLPLLKPTIERLPNAAQFIGPKRDKSIVPVRELTFQALKPNPPAKWKVVIFGQNPYPRVESATGIAMFDNTFSDWKDKQFGVVTSIRCIIKSACMWKYEIKKATSTNDIRTLLGKHKIVQPPEWFQAMLTQGVLLLNAGLTSSTDDSLSTSAHTNFWKPVVEKIIQEILAAKQSSADETHKGVVFCWWGTHAKALRALVEQMQKKYPGVPVRHVAHCNPAAAGDSFCDGDHYHAVNTALEDLGMKPVDWLPEVGWNKDLASSQEDVDRMGAFIASTIELHKMYLDRLQGVGDEKMEELPAIAGVLETPLMPFGDAIAPVARVLKGFEMVAKNAHAFGQRLHGKAGVGALSEHEIAAVHLYTMGSHFYRELNAALRDRNRDKIRPYFAYLRLFFSAVSKLSGHKDSLYRGVNADLRHQYPRGGTVAWWGVSSCTPKLSVAQGFLGHSGKRMLFEVKPAAAYSIKRYSAFTGEEEYILLPGTQLKVVDVKHETSGLSTVKLEEVPEGRLVA